MRWIESSEYSRYCYRADVKANADETANCEKAKIKIKIQIKIKNKIIINFKITLKKIYDFLLGIAEDIHTHIHT